MVQTNGYKKYQINKNAQTSRYFSQQGAVSAGISHRGRTPLGDAILTLCNYVYQRDKQWRLLD